MQNPDCPHCVRVALLAQNHNNLLKELATLADILIEKTRAENRFWERVLSEPERVG